MSIEKRHLVTGALLAFVAVTAITLAVKETDHARAIAEAEASRAPSGLAAGVPAPTTLPAVTSEESATAQRTAVATPTAMPVGPPATRSPAPKPAAPAVAPAAPAPPRAEPPTTIVVTYFHTTARCMSCLKIEDLTNATMTTRFAGPLAEKRIVWRSVNIDEATNNHFAKDYGLYTKSVIVSEVRGGSEVRWKNLDQVWNLLGDPAAFQGYVEREVRAFLDEA